MLDGEMRVGGKSNFDFLVISIKTDSGITGHSFGFAGRGAEMAGAIASSALKPFFTGKDPLFREQLWQEFRTYDRWWNHVPIYSYGPFDICLRDIAGQIAGLPIYHPLEIVNLHCCAAISNCEFLELLYPTSYMEFGMKRPNEIDSEGYAHVPEVPGIGVDWDWDFIENCTVKIL
jgi:L-alanine-DL-glutamate epimerase-like enolase superfamily enzyme